MRALLVVLALVLVAAALAAWLLAVRPPTGPERIVLVVIDTLRRDHVSAYGSRIPTPVIDSLAERGQMFSNAVSSFHQTSMSMAALFTGRTPSIETGEGSRRLSWNGSTWCGLVRFAEPGRRSLCIPDGVATLGERMSEAGYWTMGVVTNQFLYEPSGFSRGFDDWVEVDERPPLAGRESRKELENPRSSRYWAQVQRAVMAALNRRPTDRFFLYVHYIDVHDYRFQRMTYKRAVALMDRALGRLFARLEEANLLEDAVVVLTSDHGERLGEGHGLPDELPEQYGHYGNPSFQELLRVPLIVAPPVFPDPDRFVRTEDLFYMLQEIAGLETEREPDLDSDEIFVSELNYRTYRKGQWKGMMRRSDGRFHLYDLEADPGEQNDVADEVPFAKGLIVLRMDELSEQLRASPVPERELSEEERERLRILGYLEE